MSTELLFSYGTLRKKEVQIATFGKELVGEADWIVGYELGEVVITDPVVLARSGTERHPVLVPAPSDARIEGTVFTITADDLAAADEYEVDDYTRVLVPLESGRQAWVYVLADTGETSHSRTATAERS